MSSWPCTTYDIAIQNYQDAVTQVRALGICAILLAFNAA